VGNYLIRVQLPDRPGALGAVASRIGAVGGDVISIDILERSDRLVVDELGVRLPADDLLDLLQTEIVEVDGVVVEALRALDGPIPDRHAETIDAVAALLTQPSPAAVLACLAEHVRRVLGADVVGMRSTGQVDHGGTDGSGDPSRPVGAGTMVVPLPGAGDDLFVVRNRLTFREREQQWVSGMAAVADRRWCELSTRGSLV
jgi:hypothetical protein